MPRCGPAVVPPSRRRFRWLSHCCVAEARNSPRARPRRRDGRSPSRRPGGPAPQRWQRRPRRPPVTPRTHSRTDGLDRRGSLVGRTPHPRTLPERRFSGGIEGGRQHPLASLRLYRGYAGLGPVTVQKPALRTPPKRLPGHRPERRTSAHRGQAPRPPGHQPHGRRGREGDRHHSWVVDVLLSAVAAFCPARTPRGPAIVCQRRSSGPVLPEMPSRTSLSPVAGSNQVTVCSPAREKGSLI